MEEIFPPSVLQNNESLINAMHPLENVIQTLSARGFCCSQILALLILGAQGRSNPDLVRSLAGLCHGIGQSGDACGILTGGCCVISYLVGPDEEDGIAMPEAKIVQEEYVDWFREVCEERWGTIHCGTIIDEDNPKGPDKSHCKRLLAQAWVRLLGILTQHNVAFATSRGKKKEIA